jgi:rod shape-determining protein MreB
MYVVDHATDRAVESGAPTTSSHFSGQPPSDDPTSVTEPTAVGVDLGSGYLRIWASGRPLVDVPTIRDSLTSPRRLVRRGRITDPDGLRAVLARVIARDDRPLRPGPVVVACRPVLLGPDGEATARRLLTGAFAPSWLLFIDSVRAAAIGAGAAPGPLLLADVGADLTEVAVLSGGHVIGARRADIGMNDLIDPTSLGPIVRTVADLLTELRRDPDCRQPAATALGRGVVLVGGGATQPHLAARISATLGLAARPSAMPRVAAVRGAGLAAMAALRRTAMVTA